MTRINVGISPKNLIDQHLVEDREIKRIPALYKKRLDKNDFSGMPENFKLKSGHMLFFINKGLYTLKRYKEIVKERERRGFKSTDFTGNWKIFKSKHFKDWKPNSEDIEIIRNRITDRIVNMRNEPRYKGKIISRKKAIELLYK